MINGTVRYQNLKITTPLIASDTIDYLTAWFTFLTPDWAGCEVFAHFRQGETEYDCRVINGQVTADQHINLGEGVWDVYLHGDVFRDGEVIKRITTESEKITVVKSGMLNGEPFPSVPGSIVEELLAKQLDPVDKISAMTQPVGVDAAGRLWTEPQKDHPYLSLERLRSYLYRVTFQTIPAYTGAGNPVAGGCTSYVQDGKLHRNFDWTYDNAAEFEVVCPGFRGIALLGGLTDEHLEDDLIGQLPYHLADGRNGSGIMVSEHVLYNDWGWTDSGSVPMTQIPYRILSSVTSLDDFPEQIAELLADLSVPSALAEQEYLLQFLVTDGETTYCIMPPESTSGAYQCVDITANPKLTNFRWVSDETVNREDLQERPTGVERWNAIPATLEELRFTEAYESPDRLSEFIGLRGTTKDSTDAELTAIYDLAHAAYLTRTRDGSTWQTMHSVVYSASGMEHLWVQEDWKRDYIGSGADLPSTTNLIAGDGSGGAADSGIAAGDVLLSASQILTDAQKTQARANIGAIGRDEQAYTKYGVSGVGQSSPTLTRLWDAGGLSSTPGTDQTQATSSFDNLPPFNRKKCVGSWSAQDGAAKFTVAAYEDDPDYAEDGTMGDYVAVEVEPLWYIEGGGTLGVSAYPIPGWKPHPVCLNADGTIRAKTYLPVYELAKKGGHAVSLPGYHPEFGAYKTVWDAARTYGDGTTMADYAIIEPSVVDHYEWLLMTIEFATQNMQNVMQGAVSMAYDTNDKIYLDAAEANSVVVTGAIGDKYVVGQTIFIGAGHSTTPSGVDAYNVITAIEKCDATGAVSSSGTYRKITFDGTARSATGGTTKIASRPWITGSAASVLGHTGSPVSNSSAKYPCKYRHRENPYGNQNKTCLDLMDVRVEVGDSFKLQWYYNPDLTPAKYYPSSTSKPDLTDLQTAANGWKLLSVETPVASYKDGYIKEQGHDPNYPCVAVPTLTTGGSASTYFCDYASLVSSIVVRAVRRRGYLTSGASFGPRYVSAANAPSYSNWSYGGGLYFAQ